MNESSNNDTTNPTELEQAFATIIHTCAAPCYNTALDYPLMAEAAEYVRQVLGDPAFTGQPRGGLHDDLDRTVNGDDVIQYEVGNILQASAHDASYIAAYRAAGRPSGETETRVGPVVVTSSLASRLVDYVTDMRHIATVAANIERAQLRQAAQA